MIPLLMSAFRTEVLLTPATRRKGRREDPKPQLKKKKKTWVNIWYYDRAI